MICKHINTDEEGHRDLEGIIWESSRGCWVMEVKAVMTGDNIRCRIDYCPYCGTKLPA
jgi:hypothetical protein